jgi:Uma2 family endonuclease
MSVFTDTSLPPPAPPPYPIHRFSVAEYEELTRIGFLSEDDKVELLEGWIVPKMPKHPPHDGTIDLLVFLLTQLLPTGWYPRVQNSVVTADSVPEPDLVVVRGRPGDYRARHPTGAEIGLVIEVADTTVNRDRAKAAIYARAGVPHYWIVNLEKLQVEVHSQPVGAGLDARYGSHQILTGDQSLAVILDGQTVGTLTVHQILS